MSLIEALEEQAVDESFRQACRRVTGNTPPPELTTWVVKAKLVDVWASDPRYIEAKTRHPAYTQEGKIPAVDAPVPGTAFFLQQERKNDYIKLADKMKSCGINAICTKHGKSGALGVFVPHHKIAYEDGNKDLPYEEEDIEGIVKFLAYLLEENLVDYDNPLITDVFPVQIKAQAEDMHKQAILDTLEMVS